MRRRADPNAPVKEGKAVASKAAMAADWETAAVPMVGWNQLAISARHNNHEVLKNTVDTPVKEGYTALSIEFSAAKTLAAAAEYAEAAVPVSPETAVPPFMFTLSLERAAIEPVAVVTAPATAVDEARAGADTKLYCNGR